MNKEEILQIVARQLENNIEELRKALEDYEAAADLDEGDTRDLEDFSQQDESKDIQRQLQIQLDNAQEDLDRLNELSGESVSSAKFGALVETDKNWILLGISIPVLQVGDKELLGVSPESPAYSVINGKSLGERFKLGNNSFTILGIY